MLFLMEIYNNRNSNKFNKLKVVCRKKKKINNKLKVKPNLKMKTVNKFMDVILINKI